jgi:prephenate dehydratase/chorismate mutase
MRLEELRADIDRIDTRILALLRERMEKALLTTRLKTGIEDRGREGAIFERLRKASGGLVGPDFSRELFGLIVAESRALQAVGRCRAGFVGDHGSEAEAALGLWDPGAAALAWPDAASLVAAVEEGALDAAMLSLEDGLALLPSPGGSTAPARPRVVAAIDLAFAPCLLAPKRGGAGGFSRSFSSPSVLARCRGFLGRRGLEARSWPDAAGAARMVAETRPEGGAALASRRAAELYDLDIVECDIADAGLPRERFFVLSRGAGAGGLCSAVFGLGSEASTRESIIALFSRAGLDPAVTGPFRVGADESRHLLDFRGSLDEDRVARAIAVAEGLDPDFRVIGCYGELRIG